MKITIENLTKTFEPRKKTERETTAVNNMCIEIPSGKLIGLLGPSGCGKSTTLFMLSGLLKPTSGRIYFGDDDVTDLEPEKRGIGLVFQNYALYPHMTVEQNILFPLQNMRVPKEEAARRALDAATLVQIEDLMGRKPSELSGGQQQRVAIARALVKMPNVLLLDEPLSNLDARLRLQTREEIKRIQMETGITTVFVTHDQEEAMSICDTMVVMKLGVVQQIGAPQHIYDDPDNLFVANFLGTPPINIFRGFIKGGDLFIGDEKIAECDYSGWYLRKAQAINAETEAKREEYEQIKTKLTEKINSSQKSELTPEQLNALAQKKYPKVVRKLRNLHEEIEKSEKLEESLNEKIKSNVFEVFVGIRPEGFIYDENGPLTLNLDHIEIMGRDKSIVSTHDESTKPTVRTIIDAETEIEEGKESYRFNFKPSKVFVFDAETEERLRN